MWILPNVALSFNGGKDCTALMHLVRAAMHKKAVEADKAGGDEGTKLKQTGSTDMPLASLYILYKKSFDEVDDFVRDSEVRYNLKLIQKSGQMKQGLQSFKNDHPHIKGIFVGTRRDDPHGKTLDFFSPTDADWPEFMRINPVLDWSFEDIWGFIRQAGVHYCCLYNQGYTSLGDVESTVRNPALRKDGTYLPAWSLVNGSLERNGRSSPSNRSTVHSVLPVPLSRASSESSELVIGNSTNKQQSVVDEHLSR
ncbi:FAD1 flavin adenine dinucleotide synthetase [Dipsacomyces acuminosporus]|nr:FAD1 flavin adenine dinucleotide synthetase [Dipsacomyces acuminosporus]